MRIFDKNELITFKCVNCGKEHAISPGVVTLGCSNQKCFKARIVFDMDVVRCPHGTDLWQNCPAGVPFEVGFIDGTITSRLYEIKKSEVSLTSVKKSESEAQFEEKPEEEAKRVKKENPYIARLKRPTK